MAKGKIFSQLPPYAKGVIAIVITGVSVFAAFKMYLYFVKKAADRAQKKVSNQADDMVSKLANSGQRLTFAAPTYSGTANTIQQLLDGCETPATEIQVVNEIIKVVKNPIDWYYLVAQFGNRDIDNCGAFTGSTNYDLISLLKDQLESNLPGIQVNGKRYWGDNSITPLSDYLNTIGVSI